jgi:CDP-2,3-bis-(O-geranylgeranyl)-sn-glycerol synthase
MHPILLLQLLVLVAVANAAPVLAKKAFGKAPARPLDGGAVFADGRPLLGSSKTIRGLAVSLLATPIAALLTGLGWEVGAVVAVAAMAGDLLSSFVKRRLGFPPSSMAIGLDQIPESLLPLIAASWFVPVSLIDIGAGTAVFFVGGLALSCLLFKLGLRDEPY